jgi:3-phosphoshikimate 1-carboxyvinyltransferase
MEAVIEGRRTLRGTVRVPGDKSISHRAVMLGCIASGRSSIVGLSTARDVAATIGAFRLMGIPIESEGDETVIEGMGIAGFRERVDTGRELPEIDCGNSGTTARLLTGLLSGAGKQAVLTGDESLRARPMLRVIDPLNEHGADIGAAGGRLPLELTGGRVRPLRYRIPVASAQVKSALILAALFLDGSSIIVEPVPTRDHTERMLLHMDGAITTRQTGSGREIRITGGSELTPLRLQVPADLSSAVFFIAAALVTPGSSVTLENVLLNPTRARILDVLRRMGARIEVRMGVDSPEPMGNITVHHSKLRGTRVGGDEIPLIIDEIPALAACALFARGETVVYGAAELRVKESDRIGSIVGMVRAFGGRIEETGDGFRVYGRAGMKPAVVDSHGDHRMAMACSVAALAIGGRSVIRDAECVDISFPGYFEELAFHTVSERADQ